MCTVAVPCDALLPCAGHNASRGKKNKFLQNIQQAKGVGYEEGQPCQNFYIFFCESDITLLTSTLLSVTECDISAASQAKIIL